MRVSGPAASLDHLVGAGEQRRWHSESRVALAVVTSPSRRTHCGQPHSPRAGQLPPVNSHSDFRVFPDTAGRRSHAIITARRHSRRWRRFVEEVMSMLNRTLVAALIAGGASSFAGSADAVPLAASLSLRDASTSEVQTVQWRRGWRWGGLGVGLAAGAIAGAALAAPYRYGYYGYGYPAYSYAYSGYPYSSSYSYSYPTYGYSSSYSYSSGYPAYSYSSGYPAYSYGYGNAGYGYAYSNPGYYGYAYAPRLRYRAARAALWRSW
jgi:hypothetical protein